jgi:Integrase core domain
MIAAHLRKRRPKPHATWHLDEVADKAQPSLDEREVERMNRTIKDATVKRYFYETHDQLRAYLRDFVDAYNFARRLKTLRGLTPYEFMCKAWTSQPQRFTISPLQKTPGLSKRLRNRIPSGPP